MDYDGVIVDLAYIEQHASFLRHRAAQHAKGEPIDAGVTLGFAMRLRQLATNVEADLKARLAPGWAAVVHESAPEAACDDAILNSYACERCGLSWSSEWNCACDDDCPRCGLTMTPHTSTPTED